MDSEREELDRDSALLAGVLRETPTKVAAAGSEDFGVQRPGDAGGKSRSTGKMTCGLGGRYPEERPVTTRSLGARDQALCGQVPLQEGKPLGSVLSGDGGHLHVLFHSILRATG